LVVKLLDVIAPAWRDQLIEIASNASDMTGCIQGKVTRCVEKPIQRFIVFGVVLTS
jgi:hypothetical protein